MEQLPTSVDIIALMSVDLENKESELKVVTAERDQKQDAYRQAAKRAKVQAGKLTEVRRDEARKHQERLERH
eukprot:4803785-Prymnesium_polylepis.1